MSSLRNRLLWLSGAAIWARASILLLRLVQVPFFIAHLGFEDYGRWLLLYSIPSWLSLSSLGFGTAASNEMSIRIAEDKPREADEVFSTATLMLLASGCLVGLICGLFSQLAPLAWVEVFKLPDRAILGRVVGYLVVYTTISFLNELQVGRFRANHKTHLAVYFSSLRVWFELAGLWVCFNFSARFDHLAFSLLASQALHLALFVLAGFAVAPRISFSTSSFSFAVARRLLLKGLAFQGLPLGNAVIFQGSLVVVQMTLGPVAVAVFGTIRTIVRTVNQGLEIVNQTILPEMTHLIAGGQLVKAARLHRFAVWTSCVIGAAGTIFLAIAGPFLYRIWTGVEFSEPYSTWLAFLVPIPFTSIWFSSSAVLAACNRIEGLSIRYVFASVVTLGFGAALTPRYGLAAIAISALWVDIFLLIYVLRQSIAITGDSFDGLLHFPLQLARSIVHRRSLEES